MNNPVTLFYSFFSFNSHCLYVEYGTPQTPSWSYWFIPGTWEEEYA